jgi:hypothetical protein
LLKNITDEAILGLYGRYDLNVSTFGFGA